MLLSRNVVFEALVFGIISVFDISFAIGSSAADLELISTNLLENGTQNTTFAYVAGTNVQNNTTEFESVKNSFNRTKNYPQGQRKLRRFNGRRTRKRKIGTNSTMPSFRPKIKRNRTKSGFPTKKHNLRRKKIRKGGKKEKTEGSILEITTGKGNIILSRRAQSNETINKLIEKLNKNPEDNFDEFKSRKRIDKLEILLSKKANSNGIGNPLPNNTEEHDTPTANPSLKTYNRCRRNRGGCAHICHPKGTVKCSCLKGFYLEKNQRSCHDINECKFNNGQCETECVNLIGSYICKCPEGLTLTDDKLSCQDVNECLPRNGHGPCQDTCHNTFGSYKCSCQELNGTKLGSNGHTCQDIDECLENNGGCSHICINTLGRSFCSCPTGMELSSDWKTCQDINECENDDISKSCKNCLNTQGSYICLDVSDMQNDQSSSASTVCKPVFLPPRGFFNCTRKGAFQPVTKKGRKRTVNSPGTICKLVCPAGYRMLGEYYIFCGVNGEWEGNKIGKCVVASPPTLLCPPNQHATLSNGVKRQSVKFHSPVTEVHWRYVKSKPRWAKNLEGNLTNGEHDITFTVKDPHTRLFSTCSFKIFVETNSV